MNKTIDKDWFSIKIKKAENIIYEVIEDDSMILYNEVTQETHILNATAGLIFMLCDGRGLSDILNEFKEHLSDEVSISEEEIQFDVSLLIEELIDKKLIKNITE